MKKYLALWFAMLSATLAAEVEIGDSQSTVIRALGRPGVTRELGNGTVVWKFKDGTTVRFERDAVREISKPFHQAADVHVPSPISPDSGKPNLPVVSASAKSSSISESTQGSPPTSDSSSAVNGGNSRKAGYFLMGLGLLVGVVAHIKLLVAANAESSVWFLVCFFVPFGSLVFVISHWKETKYLIGAKVLVALPLLTLGIYLTPAQ